MFLSDTAELASSLPHPELDPLELGERIATECAGETWQSFVRTRLDALAALSPTALAALSAELFLRCANDPGRFCLFLSHEQRIPAEQRRTPRQLLHDLLLQGFRSPSTIAQRAGWAALMLAPPRDWATEHAARREYLGSEVRRVLHARAEAIAVTGNDPVRSDHAALLQALNDGARELTADELDEIEELCCTRYAPLPPLDAGADASTATPPPAWLN